ncbi:MAG: class I SAM-dependent methyltransferase [Pseudomonadales bacterium]|nr:class I SAM-dependent methyltransferase [Pseudomonadales bacterium]
MPNNDENWSEYWGKEGSAGEVFVNKEGGANPYLGEFWKGVFHGLTEGAKVIDLAAGAGSIFSHIPQGHTYQFHAADISATALDILKKRLPQTKTHTCPADKVPFEDHSFDMVVSQFGIEYAGHQAFIEAARLVNHGGKLSLLCHCEDGYIDAKNKKLMEGAQAAIDAKFIPNAKVLSRSLFSSSVVTQKNALTVFSPVASLMAKSVQINPEGVHCHLYFGFRQLVEKHKEYDLSDLIDWLDAMSEDIEHNLLRLSEMRKAASSESQITALCHSLEKEGLIDVTYSKFILPEHEAPLAWQVEARRG